MYVQYNNYIQTPEIPGDKIISGIEPNGAQVANTKLDKLPRVQNGFLEIVHICTHNIHTDRRDSKNKQLVCTYVQKYYTKSSRVKL